MSAAWFPVARYNSLPLALLQYKWTALPLSSNVDHWNNYSEQIILPLQKTQYCKVVSLTCIMIGSCKECQITETVEFYYCFNSGKVTYGSIFGDYDVPAFYFSIDLFNSVNSRSHTHIYLCQF